jgi:hypothetical protein
MEPQNRVRYVESEPTINRKAHFLIEGEAEALGYFFPGLEENMKGKIDTNRVCSLGFPLS